MHLPIWKEKGKTRRRRGGQRRRCSKGGRRAEGCWWGAVRCCQTSRRSLHSCRSQAHCASFRGFPRPRSCEGTSATCAAPETVCPAHRCWGWSSAWLGACPCCWGGDTHKKNTCREPAHIVRKHAETLLSSRSFYVQSLAHHFLPHAFPSHAVRHPFLASCPPSYTHIPHHSKMLSLSPHAPDLHPYPRPIHSARVTSFTPTEQIETSCFPLSCNST